MYSIFTLCTKDYRPVLDQFIDSWLTASTAEKIYIYTDIGESQWYDNNRIVMVPILEPETNWIKNVGRKPYILKDFLTRDCQNIAFIDTDCLFVRDVADIFDRDFDVAVTASITGAINGGVWFIKNTNKSPIFADMWIKQQSLLGANGVGLTPYLPAWDELSLIEITSSMMRNKDDIRVLMVDSYNTTIFDIKDMCVVNDNTRILHFCGNYKRSPWFHLVAKAADFLSAYKEHKNEVSEKQIKDGDTLYQLFGDAWEYVYRMPINQEFVKKCPNPNIIYPGLFIYYPAFLDYVK
jgi:hypothetical protein